VSGIGLLGGRLPTLGCYAPRASVTAAVSASLMGLSSPSVLAPATRFASEMTKPSVVVDLLRGRLLFEQRNRFANPLQSMFLQPFGRVSLGAIHLRLARDELVEERGSCGAGATSACSIPGEEYEGGDALLFELLEPGPVSQPRAVRRSAACWSCGSGGVSSAASFPSTWVWP